MKFDFETYMNKFVDNNNKEEKVDKINQIKKRFETDLSYWNKRDSFITNEELSKVISTSAWIRKNCDVFVVIGIGGSYMGAKAVIEALSPTYNRETPLIVFLGTNISSDEYYETLEYIKDKQIVVNVISKSGTTLEPSIAFELVMNIMKQKYSDEELKKRVIITTDIEKGELRKLVNEKKYTSFEVPRMIGGRFSVLTPVGLLPISVAGINIEKLINGIYLSKEYVEKAYEYAVIRDILYNKNKIIESYTIYNSKLYYFTEWLKQLFAETQGKNGMGILPISNVNTRDLHSMGQYLQDGKSIVFETVIGVRIGKEIKLPKYGIDLNSLNNIALKQVAIAHNNGKTPSNIITIDEINEESIGTMIHFFIISAITGALLLGINPFDQPGVEEYKKLINKELE